MSDLIDRQAAIDILLKEYNEKSLGESDQYIYGITNAMGFINNLPSADVRSNVRGEWRLMTNEEVVKSDSFGFLWANDTIMNYECTKCGYHVRNDAFVSVENRSNFCPNCGADMRGDNNED